ncbi:transketolase [Roseiterribacter gracilis]|uniref:Pyruvate dehydrogenase E1 component n=1 Tax=Roseiterribacter gracilis TaxID=2812848 RepID=A0A8S8X6Q1_9PROT|nr:pyruvate dehydrogenase E1 component [Rhodospirillales bacterium TMPK1]
MLAQPRRTPALTPSNPLDPKTLAMLRALERKVLWLATWTIHNANHLRPSRDGLKVGGHQSSSASVATLMTALYFHTLRPEDRVAVKPHASPVFHAIQYLLGKQSREKLERFRAYGGAQSYPSRTKDIDDVDFSTGSVGLGVAATLFASIVQDYAHLHRMVPDGERMGRMISLLGDAELDEGNIYEALLEGWKHDVRNCWWIIDYNRQSLDGVVSDALFRKIEGFFDNVGWNVVTLKFGKQLEAARHGPAGEAVLDWIDRCENQMYSALTFKGGAAWRERLQRDLSGTSGLKELLDQHDDASLGRLMTNLGGHDLETILEAFDAADGNETPHCFVAYTIKGWGLPLAGHKDNHAGLMNPEQLRTFQQLMNVPDGHEWEPFAGLDIDEQATRSFLSRVPFAQRQPTPVCEKIAVPAIEAPKADKMSTQEAFGKILFELARERTPLAERIVTTSPDVTVSTNLSGWVNRRGIFHRTERSDAFQAEKIASPQKWQMAPAGQHIELGIAEHNLFLLLGQLGLSDKLHGARLLPIGTVYDPFINRGLDALIYACYQGARFMIVATPSGVTLAPEGGAHQSIGTPLIGMSQDGLTYYEPAFADELAIVLQHGFNHLQDDEVGGSLYLRLTTRSIEQIQRPPTENVDWAASVVKGGYWLRKPTGSSTLALAYCGAIAPEVLEAATELAQTHPGLGVLAVTSPDALYSDWDKAQRARRAGDKEQTRKGEKASSHAETLLAELPQDAGLVTIIDGHPASLSWLGAVQRNRTQALGVTKFGQSSDLQDAFRLHGLDADSIIAAARVLTA